MRIAISAANNVAARAGGVSRWRGIPGFVALIALLLAIATPSLSHAQVTGLGSAADYGILENGGQIFVHSGTTQLSVGDGSTGNVGVIGANGGATTSIVINPGGSFAVSGAFNYSQSSLMGGAVQNNSSTNAFTYGSATGNDGTALGVAWSAATTASAKDAGLTPTQTSITSNQINGGTNPVTVASVSSIGSSGSPMALTISGTASQVFVINVSGNIYLSSVTLSGGVTANDVLFNVTGSGHNVTLGAGIVSGTFLDTGGGITLNGTTLYGALIAGGSGDLGVGVTSNDAASIHADAFAPVAAPELPTVWMAGVACLLVLGRARLRRIKRARAA
jgi:hypothetical protein